MPNSTRRFAALAALLALAVCAWGCAAQPKGQAIMLALDGPPLAIAGEAGDERFEGAMTRECMAGTGTFSIRSSERELFCDGRVDGGPGPKGRIRGIADCDDGSRLLFTLRNLGADQGLGIGRFVPGERPNEQPDEQRGAEHGEAGMEYAPQPDYLGMEPLIFFYHPWDEEARRRLVPVKRDIRQAMESKDKDQQ